MMSISNRGGMTRHTAGGNALTELILEVFRLNGLLLATGDDLVGKLGLTSARWQVLGAIALTDEPQSVAGLARSMGLSRQGVQRIVNDMHVEGFVALKPNPKHRRAQLVVLTPKGHAAFEAAAEVQTPWVNGLASGLSVSEIESAVSLSKALRARLSNKSLASGRLSSAKDCRLG